MNIKTGHALFNKLMWLIYYLRTLTWTISWFPLKNDCLWLKLIRVISSHSNRCFLCLALGNLVKVGNVRECTCHFDKDHILSQRACLSRIEYDKWQFIRYILCSRCSVSDFLSSTNDIWNIGQTSSLWSYLYWFVVFKVSLYCFM
jgi:hypothetical protein